MLPVVALVGRPNVGKSTLFNRLTKSQDAIVADVPGLTRDRRYGKVSKDNRVFIVIDTGGIGEQSDAMDSLVTSQAEIAMEESDLLLLLLDGRQGPSAVDENIAINLRKKGKPVFTVINKVDNDKIQLEDFYSISIGEPIVISAAHGHGIAELISQILAFLPDAEPFAENTDRAFVSVIGKPNVGKSTLVNTLLGEERVIVSDMPGTTRDSNAFDFEFHGKHYQLMDTAGIRRRSKISDTVEKFSVIKALQAIERAQVIIYMLDATETISDRDSSLLDYIAQQGRALVIAVNKSELLNQQDKKKWTSQFDRKCPFVQFAKVNFISALKKIGIRAMWKSLDQSLANAFRQFSTSELSQTLESALAKHQPPMIRGRRIKLRYAHQGGKNPPLIVIHGNQTKSIPEHYHRFLTNYFYQALQLQGTPLRIVYRTGENPFAGKRNQLTPRQQKRRKRLMQHVKKRK